MKRILYFIFAIAAFCGMYSCSEKPIDPQPAPENPVNDGVVIIEGVTSQYSIVYAAKGGDDAKKNAETLASVIKTATGVSLEVVSDASPVKECEIILGNGNTRKECADLEKEIKKFGYRLTRAGKKLIVTGSDYNHTVMALDRLYRYVVKNRTYASKGYLKFPDSKAASEDFEITQASLKNIVKNNWKHEFTLTRIVAQKPDGALTTAQGVCCDGENVYFVLKNGGNDTQARVYKYRMSDWSFVAKTDIFNGGHCNDLVWDPNNKRVISIRGGVDASIKEQTVAVDPVTMKTSEGPAIPGGATAIDYNPSLKRYITRYGKNLCQRGLDMKVIMTTQRNDGNTMTSQGMGSDDEYFYFPMSPKNKENYNAILVYDWKTGSYVTTLQIPSSRESESMFEHEGVYYVVFYMWNECAVLYRIDVKLQF